MKAKGSFQRKNNLFGIRYSFQELILIIWILISEATFQGNL